MTASRWLASLVQKLRDAGLPIPPSRLLDAARALLVSGDLTVDRELLGEVLRLVLAQRREERAVFDRVFAAFVKAHGPPRPQRRAHPRSAAGAEDAHSGSGRAESHRGNPGLPDSRRSGAHFSAGEAAAPLDAPGERLLEWAERRFPDVSSVPEMASIVPEAVSSAREATAGAREAAAGAKRHVDRGEEDDALARALASLERTAARGETGSGGETRREGSKGEATLASYGDRGSTFGPARSGISHKRGSDVPPALLRAVRRMAAALHLRRSRRTRRFKRGRVDMKGTLARSFRTDGTPFRIVRRRRRMRPARLLLLLDVSGSMRSAAEFVLAVAQGLRGAFTSVGAFAFVDHPIDAGRVLEQGAPLDALAEVNWMSQSDYGNTFFKLLNEHDRALLKDVLLVVMGDARNNFADPMTWTLADIRGRVGWLLWLNPEPRRRWNTGDSVLSQYAPWCDRILRCADLADLKAAAETLAHRATRWR